MRNSTKCWGVLGLLTGALLSGCAGSTGLSYFVEGNRCQGVLVPGIVLNITLSDGNPADPARDLSVVFTRGSDTTSVRWTPDQKETRLSGGYWSRESPNFYEEFVPDAQGGKLSQGAYDGFEGLPAAGPIRLDGPATSGNFDVTIAHSQYQPQVLRNIHVEGDTCQPVTKTVDVTLLPR